MSFAGERLVTESIVRPVTHVLELRLTSNRSFNFNVPPPSNKKARTKLEPLYLRLFYNCKIDNSTGRMCCF